MCRAIANTAQRGEAFFGQPVGRAWRNGTDWPCISPSGSLSLLLAASRAATVSVSVVCCRYRHPAACHQPAPTGSLAAGAVLGRRRVYARSPAPSSRRAERQALPPMSAMRGTAAAGLLLGSSYRAGDSFSTPRTLFLDPYMTSGHLTSEAGKLPIVRASSALQFTAQVRPVGSLPDECPVRLET